MSLRPGRSRSASLPEQDTTECNAKEESDLGGRLELSGQTGELAGIAGRDGLGLRICQSEGPTALTIKLAVRGRREERAAEYLPERAITLLKTGRAGGK